MTRRAFFALLTAAAAVGLKPARRAERGVVVQCIETGNYLTGSAWTFRVHMGESIVVQPRGSWPAGEGTAFLAQSPRWPRA